MLRLSCAAVLEVKGIGKCPPDVDRFKSSCLSCRMRRAKAGKFTLPKHYIKYTYTSWRYVFLLPNGLCVFRYPYVLVDPRGHFTSLRVAAIIVLDGVIKWWRRVYRDRRHNRKPWVELCEFLANFPVW